MPNKIIYKVFWIGNDVGMQGMLQKSYQLVDPPPLYKLRHLIGSNGQNYFVNHKQILRNLAESQMLNIAFLVSYCELWEDFIFKVRSVAQPCWDFSRIFRCSLTMHWGYWNFPTKNSKILKSVMQCQLEVETGGHRLTLATSSCCPSFLLDCMQLQCFLSCLVILHKILSSSILEEAKGH